jgi:hypothetical protein
MSIGSKGSSCILFETSLILRWKEMQSTLETIISFIPRELVDQFRMSRMVDRSSKNVYIKLLKIRLLLMSADICNLSLKFHAVLLAERVVAPVRQSRMNLRIPLGHPLVLVRAHRTVQMLCQLGWPSRGVADTVGTRSQQQDAEHCARFGTGPGTGAHCFVFQKKWIS